MLLDADDRLKGISPANPRPKDSAVNKTSSKKAQAVAVRRAGVQAVKACSTDTVATVHTGMACKDRDAEAAAITIDRLL